MIGSINVRTELSRVILSHVTRSSEGAQRNLEYQVSINRRPATMGVSALGFAAPFEAVGGAWQFSMAFKFLRVGTPTGSHTELSANRPRFARGCNLTCSQQPLTKQSQSLVQPLPTPPPPAVPSAFPSLHHVAPDLLGHPVSDVMEAPTGVPDRKVVGVVGISRQLPAAARRWLDRFHHALDGIHKS